MRAAILAILLSACGAPPEPGPVGPMGPPGPRGDPGADGAPGGALARHTSCFGTQILAYSIDVSAYYDRYDFEDGTVFVTCMIHVSEASPREKRSAPIFYLPGSANALDGACSVILDVDTPNGDGEGAFNFTLPYLSWKGDVLYQDASNPVTNNTHFSLDCAGSSRN